MAGLDRVDAVGHRIVHGGAAVRGPDGARRERPRPDRGPDRAGPAAPAARRGRHRRDRRPCCPGCRPWRASTPSFHHDLPAAAATYALPRDWNRRWQLRRYGFHGLSHAHAARRAAQLPDRENPRVVSCHLGAGASLAAVTGGRSVDTTMGFTPLAGLVMATRSGSVDPGLVLWLLRHAGVDVEELDDALEHESGLAGLAGGSGDMRDVLRAAEAGEADATRAFDVYVHRLRREIAGMAAAMDGLDVLVFTGGVGEHQPPVRAAAAAGLGFLGVRLDEHANRAASGDADITAAGAPVATLVVTAREDREIARQTRAELGAHAAR